MSAFERFLKEYGGTAISLLAGALIVIAIIALVDSRSARDRPEGDRRDDGG